MKRQRGVALLLVLWVLALLSLLLGGLAGWVQLESRQALWHRQHTQALLAAEAGVALAMQTLADPLQRKQWIADGREMPLVFDDAQLHVSLHSERGKLYLNSAEAADFARLALACGATQAQAEEALQDCRLQARLAPQPRAGTDLTRPAKAGAMDQVDDREAREAAEFQRCMREKGFRATR
jgi:general secretion pathway protein K